MRALIRPAMVSFLAWKAGPRLVRAQSSLGNDQSKQHRKRGVVHLEGSCHCGAVTFSVEAGSPMPDMHCYCVICRKTAGGGGYAINLGADNRTLKVKGRENISAYRSRLRKTESGKDEANAKRRKSSARRSFCKKCGSALWVYSPDWPDHIHPFASAIDTPLPKSPEALHIFLDNADSWMEIPKGKKHSHFARYPDQSPEDWHREHGVWKGQ